MFTETVTISLERYEQLKRFDSMENRDRVYLIKEIEGRLFKLNSCYTQNKKDDLVREMEDLCRKLQGYEER